MLQLLLLVFGGIVWEPFGPAISYFCLGVLFEIFIYTLCTGYQVSEYIMFDQTLSSLFLKQFSVVDITTSSDREF